MNKLVFFTSLVLQLILLLVSFKVALGAKSDLCAIFYRETGGDVTKLSNNQYVSDLELSSERAAKELTWIPFKKFSISKGCSSTICNGTDFDGVCQTFTGQNINEILSQPQTFDDIKSASCSCEVSCKCSDQYIRNTGCARAYINHDCNSCKSFYIDMRNISIGISPEIRDNISSIIVRPGCSLKTYTEEDLDGEETSFEGIVEKWDSTLASFDCQCTSSQPKRIIPPNENDPKLVAIPETLDKLSELSTLNYEHPGIAASLKSYKRKRSAKNAYILLLGLTGAGKSSAINVLFDNPNVTKTGYGVSTTTDIHEFRIPVPLPELGIENSELRVIDTPGLGDTRGLEQDARFLATLDDYLSGHEELSNRIPNVVLVFAKFNDNRFKGKASSFVKMLSGIEALRERITDKSFSNVIFVLTHLMQVDKNTKRKPGKLMSQWKETIQEFSLFPRPISIVIGENKGDLDDLLMLNGYYRLPNGEFYPRNLFDKIQQVTTFGEDPIGEAIIRTAFRDSSDFNISNYNFRLVNAAHGKTLKYLKLLSDSSFEIERTEISKLLEKAETEMPPELKSKYLDALPYIQRAFNLRKIHNEAELPKTKLELVKFLRDIQQNEANMWLMKKAFGIQSPTFQENIVAGSSYNVIEDTVLPFSPFVLGKNIPSDIGYLLPEIITCEIKGENVGLFQTFSSKASYIESRLKNLGVEGNIPETIFQGVPVPGSNLIILNNETSTKPITITALREHRNFELILNNNYKLNENFLKAVRALTPLVETSAESIEIWKDFFQKYGTHVVKSAYGGGSIEIKINSPTGLKPNLEDGLFELVKFAEDVSSGQVRINTTLTIHNDTSHSLQFYGGDNKYYTNSLKSMPLSAAAELLENWKDSINLNPSILRTDLKLLSLSQIVKKLPEKNISSEIERAISVLFNTKLRQIIKPTNDGYPTSRENTTALQQTSDFFKEFTVLMLENQRKSDERFQSLMEKISEAARLAEERRENDAKELLKWQRERDDKLEAIRRQDIKDARERRDKRQEAERIYRQQQDKYRADKEREERAYRLEQDRLRQELYERNPDIKRPFHDDHRPVSCLKENTFITMFDKSEKRVKDLQTGDLILDGELKQAIVIGISYEFIQGHFYGFNNETPFFTNTHLFIGESGNENFKLFVPSTRLLYKNNPLMEYMSVSDMRSGFMGKSLDKNGQVENKYLSVQKSQNKPDKSTKVYFLEVDSPSGTYFANGYMSRHETPPYEYWPRTMPIFFTLLEKSEILSSVSKLPYTLENLNIILNLIENIENRVEKAIINYNLMKVENDVSNIFKQIEEFELEAIIKNLYSNPSIVASTFGVYGTSGKIIANYIEDKDWPTEKVNAFQNFIFNEIYHELINFNDNMQKLL